MKVRAARDLVLIVDRIPDSPAHAKVEIRSATVNVLKHNMETPRSEDLLDLSADIQGVIFGSSETCCMIASDRFGSVPIYSYQTPSRSVFSTNLANIFEYVLSPLSIDRAAMWESVLIDMPLAPRTLFQEIRQITPGTMIVLDFADWSVLETDYYNFTFPSVPTHSVEQSVDCLIDVLRTKLQEIAHEPLLLPLSGGVDSRLLAAMLCDLVSPDDIHAVTFAFGKQSLEWSLAKEVCRRLAIKRHTFHPITPECYTAALPDFMEKFGGGVSVFHAHLYSFLVSSPEVRNRRLVSGFFADAAAGYASAPPQETEAKLRDSGYYVAFEFWNKKFSVPYMSDIVEDLRNVFKSWQSGSSISSFHEYVYVSQRQQQLLFSLASMYRTLVPVEMPYAMPSVANALFAMPYSVRQFKGGIRRATAKVAPKLAGLSDVSSKPRRATWKERLGSLPLRLWHRMTIAGAMATRDLVNLPDFGKTETHAQSLRTCHRDLLLSSIEFLQRVDLIGAEPASVLRARSYDYHFPVPQYRVISLAHLIQYLRDKELLQI